MLRDQCINNRKKDIVFDFNSERNTRVYLIGQREWTRGIDIRRNKNKSMICIPESMMKRI